MAMYKLLGSRSFHILLAALLIGAAILLIIRSTSNSKNESVTASVSRGDVVELVSVSGFVEAQNAAELAFPVTGIVDKVFVDEGDVVTEGQQLIVLQRNTLLADRRNAEADLLRAEADRDELVAGPRSEARDITATQVAIAEADLAQTQREELEKVDNARRALLSTGLTALSLKGNEDAAAPTISGTYTCEEEGSYQIEVFRSAADSGFSFRVSGLESGTYTAYVDQPGRFGNCGLFLQFGSSGLYNNSLWEIQIPNRNAANYVTYLNAYELAVEQAENAIESAEQAVELATQEATLENAAPRDEALRRANATVASAAARLAAIDAQLADRVITAPFDGVVTSVEVLPGETVTASPIITVLANDTFDMTSRIPEIDITKIALDQRANIIFDARSEEVVPATVHFISPIAVEIDGVAYFEATMVFENSPEWLRSGLNADVDIIVDQLENVLRLPKRFVTIEEDQAFVLLPNEFNPKAEPTKREVDVLFDGNDGYIAIDGLSEGMTVVAP